MIKLNRISKHYEDKVGFSINLLKEISLEAEEGKITSILAPKGSGKSTLIKIICGLEKPDSGEIENSTGAKINYIPPESYSFPWLSTEENLCLVPAKKDVAEALKIVGLDGYEKYYPHSKSLGFRFRIALARALVNDAKVICLDEPFLRMDEITRAEIYMLVHKVNIKMGTAFLLATTNITEALFLSHKIYLMKKNPGEIIYLHAVDLPAQRNLDLLGAPAFLEQRFLLESKFTNAESRQLLNITI